MHVCFRKAGSALLLQTRTRNTNDPIFRPPDRAAPQLGWDPEARRGNRKDSARAGLGGVAAQRVLPVSNVLRISRIRVPSTAMKKIYPDWPTVNAPRIPVPCHQLKLPYCHRHQGKERCQLGGLIAMPTAIFSFKSTQEELPGSPTAGNQARHSPSPAGYEVNV